jgi:hypothetical protein
LERLIEAVAHHVEDAVELLKVIHIFARGEDGPANESRRHSRVRALADLALLIESTLRAWQAGLDGKQLHNRMQSLLSVKRGRWAGIR